MKKIYFLLFFFSVCCTMTYAQKRTFLRVYNIDGHKLAKGYLYNITDSSVLIFKDTIVKEIIAKNIGYIKTRRSLGHNILIGALSGGIPGGIIGVASGEPNTNDATFGGILHDAVTFTPGEAAVLGIIVGGVLGSVTGALIHGFTKHTVFTVNGSPEEWIKQRNALNLLPHKIE